MAQYMNFPIVNPMESAISAYGTVSGAQREKERTRMQQAESQLQRELAGKQIGSFEEQLAAELGLMRAQQQQAETSAMAQQQILPYEMQQQALAAQLQELEANKLQQLYGMGAYTPETQKIASLMGLMNGFDGANGVDQVPNMPPMGRQAVNAAEVSIIEGGNPNADLISNTAPEELDESIQEASWNQVDNMQNMVQNQIMEQIQYALMSPAQQQAYNERLKREAVLEAEHTKELVKDSSAAIDASYDTLKYIDEAQEAYDSIWSGLKGTSTRAASGKVLSELMSGTGLNKSQKEARDRFSKNMANLRTSLVRGLQKGHINEADYKQVDAMIAGNLDVDPQAFTRVMNSLRAESIRDSEKAEFTKAMLDSGRTDPLLISSMWNSYQNEMPAFSPTGALLNENLGKWTDFFGMPGRSQYEGFKPKTTRAKKEGNKEDPLGIR